MPFMAILDGCVVSKRGDLTWGWELRLPVAYSVNEEGYDSIIGTFMRAYRVLPDYAVVHKQDVFRYDVYHARPRKGFLADCYDRHFDGREFLNGFCYVYVTFSTKASVTKSVDSGSLLFDVTGKVPSERRIEECAGYADTFSSVLSGNGLLGVRPMTGEDWLSVGAHGEDEGVIADYLRFYSFDKGLAMDLGFHRDRVVRGDVEARVWYVRDGDSYPERVSSVNYVDSMSTVSSQVFLSGGSPIGYDLKIPHVVNRYIVKLPVNQVNSELEQKRRFMNAFSLYSAACRQNGEELQEYLDASAMTGLSAVKCFTSVMAWGRHEEMQDVRNKIVTAFSLLNMSVAEETRACPALHYAGIPSAGAELGWNYYMTGEMVSFLCGGLWDGYDSGMADGCIRLCDRARFVPVTLDIQGAARARGYIDNMNAIVVGPSGSGKSFTMNTLVRNFYDHGEHIMIIDVGDSYQGLCSVVCEETHGEDGIYNTYDPDRPFTFNPFRGRRSWGQKDEDGDEKSSGLAFFYSLVQTMYQPRGGWTAQASGILSQMTENFFRMWDEGYDEGLTASLREAYVNARKLRSIKLESGFDEARVAAEFKSPLPGIFPADRADDPVFDDFYRFVTQVVAPLILDDNYYYDNVLVTKDMFPVDEFGIALGKFRRGGEYGFLLNSREERDIFASRLTVFEVDRIKDNNDLFPLWILCILHSFEDKMRSLSCQKVMVIEEAWSAIARPTMAKFIVWLWRTARKFSTSAIVVTQSLSDLVSNDIVKDAIILNSSVKILLDQSKNAAKFQESADILAMSEKDVKSVLSVGRSLDPRYNYKEGYFGIGESHGNVYAIEVSEEEALVYESDKTKKKPLFDLAARKGSMIEAVREMADAMRLRSRGRARGEGGSGGGS